MRTEGVSTGAFSARSVRFLPKRAENCSRFPSESYSVVLAGGGGGLNWGALRADPEGKKEPHVSPRALYAPTYSSQKRQKLDRHPLVVVLAGGSVGLQV